MSQSQKYTGPSAKAFEDYSKERDINSILEQIRVASEMIKAKGGNYTIDEERTLYQAGEAIMAIKSSYTPEDRIILNVAREIQWKLENPQYRSIFLNEDGILNNRKREQTKGSKPPREKSQKNASKLKKSSMRRLPKLSPRAKSLIRRFSKSPAAYFLAALTITGVSGSIINDIKEKEIKSAKDTVSSNMEILDSNENSSTEAVIVSSIDELGAKDNEVKYILDFINYSNPDLGPLMNEWISSDAIGGFIFECGAGGHDYPYAIRNFQDEELESKMSQVISPENLSGKMGNLESLENIIQHIIANPENGEIKPYGFYFYSTANTYAEADIEAEYIANFYEILQKRMQEQNPTYSIYDNTFPITIDIEDNGEIKYGETPEEISRLREQRTDAMIYLADKLVEKGVTTKEKGVTIYMDVNRVADSSYVDHDRLVGAIEEQGIRVANWGTRALEETFESDKIYRSADELQYDTMNDINNLDWMESEFISKNDTIKYTENLNLCQIRLNQQIRGVFGLDQTVDVNITTSDNIQWMLSEEDCAIETPFLTQIQMIEDRKTQNNKSIGEEQNIDITQTDKDDYDR
ncbi:MAG: hypothetical protein J6J36_02000 [Clostridia bacterium]|nr:hypothetical protein [Clostridia bacterium]